MLIYPRYAGSVVSARRIVYVTGEYEQEYAMIEESPVFSTVCGEEDCIGAALERPEDAPCWVITVQAPNGAEGSWILSKNNSYGTPVYEYLTDESAANRETYVEATYETAKNILRELGYVTPSFQHEYDESNPYVLLGNSLTRSAASLPEQSGLKPLVLLHNELLGGDSAVCLDWENQMIGDTCVLEAAIMHEHYVDEMYVYHLNENNEVISVDHPETLGDFVAGQAELFAEERFLGYGGDMADEGEELYFDLSGLLVYNHTLAAKTVSISVNGEEVGEFALTEGDFFTVIPLDCMGLPGDKPVRVELRVLETRFGTPEQALLWLLPFLGSPLSGGR